jgi:hypothetical protein
VRGGELRKAKQRKGKKSEERELVRGNYVGDKRNPQISPLLPLFVAV